MKKLWHVAVYEYQRNVFKRSFIFTLLSIPFFIAFSVGLGLFMESQRDNSLPVGYVDRAGVLVEDAFREIATRWAADHGDPLTFISFPAEADGRAALEARQIQACFILPSDYPETRRLDVLYVKEPGENAWRQFYDFLQVSLLADQPQEIAYRAASGAEFVVRSIDGARQAPTGGPTFGLLMPLFIAAAFLFMLMLSAGYTLSAVADEKENRTMEVLITAISPLQLIGGKILGIVAVSLTLLFSWTAVVAIGIFVGRAAGINWLNDLSMDWRTVIAVVAIGIPSYVLATALMTAVGATVSTVQEGQSVSALFFILHVVPFYVSWSFLSTPHSPLATVMSILPFTSLMTVGMRNLFTIVPAWQVAVSVAIQTAGAAGAIWLASRAFRLGMLRYGKRLSWRQVLQRG